MVKNFIDSGNLDSERDNSGMVHDADYDHAGAGTLSNGYLYGGLTHSLYGSGLVGWWPLHERSGQANDLSGSDNHGTLNDTPTQGVGGRGGLSGYYFSGPNDYIDIPNFSQFSSYTISFWAWPDLPDGGEQTVVNLKANNQFDVNLDHANYSQQWQLQHNDGSGTWIRVGGGPTVQTDTWYYVVATWDGSTIRLYVDTNEVDSASVSTVGSSGAGGDEIAAWTDNSLYFHGVLSDVRVYNRALSASEIQTLYDWGSGDYAHPPDNDDGGISYYHFNSSNANDAWGSNDGTVNGATYVSDGGPRGDGVYSFDGSDDYISIDGAASIISNTSFSISCWDRRDSLGQNDSLFGGGVNPSTDNENFLTQYLSDDRITFAFHGDDLQTTETFPAGVWKHWTFTFDDATNRQAIYYNGALQIDRISNGSVDTGGDLDIGRDHDDGDYYGGDITDVRFYNRALEPWEIQEIYQYGTLGRDLRHHTVNAT